MSAFFFDADFSKLWNYSTLILGCVYCNVLIFSVLCFCGTLALL